VVIAEQQFTASIVAKNNVNLIILINFLNYLLAFKTGLQGWQLNFDYNFLVNDFITLEGGSFR